MAQLPESPSHGKPTAHSSSLGCTKLRDSCQSCATSKIKCSKERPACLKCVARGVDCQYVFARRPGRRPENGTGNPNSCTSRNNNAIVEAGNSTGSAARSVPMAILPYPRLSPRACQFAYGSAAPSGTLAAPQPDTVMEADTLDALSLLGGDIDMDDLDFFLTSANIHHAPPSDISSLFVPHAPTAAVAGASCGCMARALDLLQTLSSAPAARTDVSQVMLAENKEHIETAGAMIACSTCTDDVFLLVVLSMIVLKILERYAEPDVAARLADSIVLGPVHAHDSSVPPLPGELHHVQRLVDQLSPRLKAKGQTEGGKNDVEVEGQDFVGMEETSRSKAAHFFPYTLTQMESDLRQRVSSLFGDVISRLPQN